MFCIVLDESQFDKDLETLFRRRAKDVDSYSYFDFDTGKVKRRRSKAEMYQDPFRGTKESKPYKLKSSNRIKYNIDKNLSTGTTFRVFYIFLLQNFI